MKFNRSIFTIVAVLLLSVVLAVFPQSSESAWLRALFPAAVALLVTVLTQQAILGLMLGAFSGVLFLTKGDVFGSVRSMVESHIFPALSGSWHVGAILFTLILGAFAMVVERSGGFETLANRLLSKGKGDVRRRFEGVTAGLGLLCFFDGLANSLLLGRIAKPLADRLGVSRAKLAYIVDSTSSSVACIAFISTWIATQLSLIEQSTSSYVQVTDGAYVLFFKSIPNNFYCLFTLILLVLVILRRWDIGAMKRAKVRVVSAEELKRKAESESPVRVALMPIFVLSAAILILFYTWDTGEIFPVTGDKLSTAFSGKAGPYALTLGALVGLFAACVYFPRGKMPELSNVVREGVSSMLQPVLLLIMAWTFGSVISELGTGRWVASGLGEYVSAGYIPAAVFVTGSAIAFTTGSSWGTMALLMPIALPAYLDLAGGDVDLLPATIAAVFGGAVFGDHCSPFSDTTIVSAFACGVSPEEHVVTQLPYALIAAGTALLLGYVLVGNGVDAGVGLLLGMLFLGLLTCFFTRSNRFQEG